METKQMITEEKVLKAKSGWSMLFLSIILYLAFIGGLIGGIFLCTVNKAFAGTALIILGSIAFIAAIIIDCGFKVMKP